jgi:TPR repeat protein
MEWLKRVCRDNESGDVVADPAEFYYDIGKRLVLGKEEGMEVNRNVTRGIECLMRAAELGHAAAGWDLQCFEPVGEGGGLRLDFTKAAQLYQMHVDRGHCMAQSNLGVCYHKGRGIEQNLDKAVALYMAAAEQGYPRALYNLAVCYDLGEGVEVNIPKAVELYFRSAKGGYAVAQYYMGVCFLNGKGLPEKDPQKAIEMWTRAANQGHAFAQYSLAQAYRDGMGVEKDLLKAASYFVAFTRWGDESGWDCLKALLSRPLDNPFPAQFHGSISSLHRQRLHPTGSHSASNLPSLFASTTSTSSSISAPSSPLVSHHNSSSSSQPVQYRCFSERKQVKFEDHFHVPNLYDLCCLYYHTQWTRLLENAEIIAEDAVNTATGQATCCISGGHKRKAEEELLPAEVRHRIKYENVYCCRPKCRNFFFGQGRVQRKFFLRQGAGGTECEADDVTLHFCSLECAAFELSPGVAAGWKEFQAAPVPASASS